MAEGVALEFVTGASGDHGAKTGPDDVEDEAHDGEGWVKLDNGFFAA